MADEKFRVLIATTNGPVEVLLLTEEDPAVGRSVACIGGTTETADIAAAYHAFVARPTGIIARLFGHPCYRLDVSGRIDAGTSWQLGVLAAHALHAAGRLAQERDAADGVVWATGSVRPVDLTIGRVSHVAEKVASSRARLSEEIATGRHVFIAFPAQNAGELADALETNGGPGGMELLKLSNAGDLCNRLGAPLAEKPRADTGVREDPRPNPATMPVGRPAVWAAVGAGVLAATAAVAYLLVRPPPTVADPPPHTALLQQGANTLVPETVPFVSARDQGVIRSTYLPGPDYKALAISANRIGFSTAQRDQATAQTAALDACQRVSDAAPARSACELYAIGNVVVSRRGRPPMPPQPWVIRDASIERPFAAKDVPLVSEETRIKIDKEFGRARNPRALAVSQNGYFTAYGYEGSVEEAVRRSLERCGSNSGAACMIIAIDGIFVVPIPGSARIVGFVRTGLPDTIAPELRESIARRLGNATHGWNALAVGASGRVGISLGAETERAAVDDAMSDCLRHDRECRVAVIGPFLVEPSMADAAPTATSTAAQPNGSTLSDQLIVALASALPKLDASTREDLARKYVALANHKSLAVVPGTTMHWRSAEWPTANAAEDGGLERCQVFHVTPCALIVLDDRMQAPSPDGPWRIRDMARAGYAGIFEPEQIPGVGQAVRDRADIAGYRKAPAPKAAAYHPWGRVFTALNAENQHAAEALALSICNADSTRLGQDGPCRLYAVGDQVVLPQRRTEPATP